MSSFGSKGTHSTSLTSSHWCVIPLQRAWLCSEAAALVPSLWDTCKAKCLFFYRGKVLPYKQVGWAGMSWLRRTGQEHEHFESLRSPTVHAGGCAEGERCEHVSGQQWPLRFPWAGWEEGGFGGAHAAYGCFASPPCPHQGLTSLVN